MKVVHSTYMSSKGSLGLMKGELEINTTTPFIPKLSLNYSILKDMNEKGLISIDIEKLEKVSVGHKHNHKLINQYEKLIRILKTYFDYEYYDQNSFAMEFFTGRKEKMLKDLSEILENKEENSEYEGVFNFDKGSAYFVFNGTLLTVSPKETKSMFAAINEYFAKHIAETEKEVEEDYNLYKKYEKISSEEGFTKIKEYIILMAECGCDCSIFAQNAEGLNNYIMELDNSNVYIN